MTNVETRLPLADTDSGSVTTRGGAAKSPARAPGASRIARAFLALGLGLAVSVAAVGEADARRAGSFGSFGSRGVRTYQAPAPTPVAPRTAQPIERTMTPRPAQQPGAAATAPATASRGLFGGGFMGSMLGGLMLGGLVGMMFGHGFGGGMMGGGMLGGLLQLALLGVGIFFLMRFLGRRNEGASLAGAGAPGRYAAGPDPRQSGTAAIFGMGGGSGSASAGDGSGRRWPGDEIGIGDQDLDRFETLLGEIQRAYAAEDFAALRAVTTPEAMGFLAEEIGGNATRGVRNEVSDVRLIDGDVAEAWREDGIDYATVAMRFSSRDVLLDRATGTLVGGSEEPQEATEVWTFRRNRGEDWKLAAVQAA